MYNSLPLKRVLYSTVLLMVCSIVQAQTHKLYPLFIYSFTRHIQWPDVYNQGDFEIIVLGETPLIDELKNMAQTKKVGDRAIKITRINTPGEIRKCNILFVPEAQAGKLKEILPKVSSLSVLVITETVGLAQQGSCINFIVKDGKLAFELNQSALTKQNLKASTEITQLAIMI
jgi:hypothetical protein